MKTERSKARAISIFGVPFPSLTTLQKALNFPVRSKQSILDYHPSLEAYIMAQGGYASQSECVEKLKAVAAKLAGKEQPQLTPAEVWALQGVFMAGLESYDLVGFNSRFGTDFKAATLAALFASLVKRASKS